MHVRREIWADDWVVVPYIAIMVTFLSFLGVYLSSP